MDELDNDLLRLRDEFAKRSEDTGAMNRVKYAFEHSQRPALIIHPHAMFTDGVDHGYEMTITFNLYHTEEESIEAVKKEVIELYIRSAQKMMHEYDNPESRAPSVILGWGKRSTSTQIRLLEESLLAYDLLSIGKNLTEITKKLFPKEVEGINSPSEKSGNDVWKSAYEKTRSRIENAKKQIKAVKEGKFPR